VSKHKKGRRHAALLVEMPGLEISQERLLAAVALRRQARDACARLAKEATELRHSLENGTRIEPGIISLALSFEEKGGSRTETLLLDGQPMMED